MSTTACINEIFSSLQGEGSLAGEKMTFVRFSKCTLGCQWCDTDHSENNTCNVFEGDGEKPSFIINNPISVTQLLEILANYTDDYIAVTGGEPLEQSGFLAEFLPIIGQKRKVLLETNGIHADQLNEVSRFVDIISMDIKLPSSTGREALWAEHERFLNTSLASGKEIYVKLVVTSSTTDKDINEAIKLITKTNRYIPVFIQPVSPTEVYTDNVSEDKLKSFERLFAAWLPNVKVAPQMHKIWDIK